MAIVPPFNINETSPAASSLISSFPADEQLNRATIEAWLSFISDPATGLIRSSVLPASADPIPSGTKMLFVQTAAPTGWTKDITHNNKALRLVNGTVGTGGTVVFTTAFASQAVAGTNANTTATGTNGAVTDTGTIGNTTSTGTVGGYALVAADIPAHTHSFSATTSTDPGHLHNAPSGTSAGGGVRALVTGSGGSNGTFPTDTQGSHSHTVSGTTGSIGSGGSHTHSLAMNAHNHTVTMNSHNHTFTGVAHTHVFTGTAIDLTVQYVDVIIATHN